MVHITKLGAILLLLAVGSIASAQAIPEQANENARAVYHRTTAMPNGPAFKILVRYLNDISTEAGEGAALSHVQNNLELDEVEAAAFLIHANTVLQNITADAKLAKSNYACATDGIVDPAEIMESFDDIAILISEDYFDQVKSGLSGKSRHLLQVWMDEIKTHTVFTLTDFHKSAARGVDLSARVSARCNGGTQ